MNFSACPSSCWPCSTRLSRRGARSLCSSEDGPTHGLGRSVQDAGAVSPRFWSSSTTSLFLTQDMISCHVLGKSLLGSSLRFERR